MKRFQLLWLMVTLVVMTGLASDQTKETEKGKAAKVNLTILPKAVLTAFKTAYPNAVIKGTSKEIEKDVTYFEVESVDGKLDRDILYTVDGKAAEIEETVLPQDLPAVVLQALIKQFTSYKIVKAEALTKGDQKLFEMLIQVAGKKIEVTSDSNGKISKKPVGATKKEKDRTSSEKSQFAVL
jgi:hypothetical protein